MRNILFILLVAIICNKSHSQRIYFGLPDTIEKINVADKFILNLPTHVDGRFVDKNNFEGLFKLLKRYPDFQFNIEINCFIGTSKMSFDYTESLKQNLYSIAKYKSDITNFKIIANGSSNAIFLKKENKDYKKINNRIEVLVVKISP